MCGASRSARLAGLAAQPFSDQPLAERPQGPRRVFALSLRRGQAAAAVVEVHASQTLELGSSSAVDGGGSSLLLESKEKKRPKKLLFVCFFLKKKIGDETTFF